MTLLASRHTLEQEILRGQPACTELRTALRELLARIERNGHAVNLHSLATHLAQFTPELPLERAEEWQARAQQRWLESTKPALIDCLADYFIR
ncbi:hypothetical protein [Pseudomonas sp. Gutcm_11s]|uniref:hypothetical protein n=1 Tax=Pseudomonas sp. Gutcm_11s TaxID=3026088 RepID=UPI0023612A10|nr:hypothetical protein [Pseudomonas sp. Gutcm_11s]MDD0842883.1 hypothetical protein [Pseudomonas sp. Gutcm_11s]